MANSVQQDTLSPDYFKKGSLILMLGVLIGFAADYGFNLTLSNALSSHEYGDYKVAYAFAAITSVLVLLGGDRLAPRLLSPPLSQGDNRPVWEFLRFYMGLGLGLSLLVIVATAIAAVLHLGSTDLQDHHPLLTMSLVVPLIAIGSLISRVLQAAKFQALSNLPWRIALPVIKTALILLLMLLLSEVHLWHVIASGATAVCLIIAFQWHHIRRNALLSFQRAPEQLSGTSVLKMSIPMMLAMLITLALNQIDLFMLEALAQSEQDVGHFAAAATTAHILPLAQVTIAGLFLPLIAPALAQGIAPARRLFWQGQKAISITVAILTLILFMAGPWLLSIFGNDFQVAEQALHYLAAGYALWALAAFASTWLQYTDQGRSVVLIGCATLLLDGGCNLWLIPRYGIDGAAIATCIAMGFAATATCWVSYQNWRQALKPAT